MSFNFFKRESEQDWRKYFGELPPATRKAKLIDICEREDISIFIDDPGENVHTPFRAVASEAELERRLWAKRAVSYSLHSRWIALIALIVSVCALLLEAYGTWPR